MIRPMLALFSGSLLLASMGGCAETNAQIDEVDEVGKAEFEERIETLELAYYGLMERSRYFTQLNEAIRVEGGVVTIQGGLKITDFQGKLVAELTISPAVVLYDPAGKQRASLYVQTFVATNHAGLSLKGDDNHKITLQAGPGSALILADEITAKDGVYSDDGEAVFGKVTYREMVQQP